MPGDAVYVWGTATASPPTSEDFIALFTPFGEVLSVHYKATNRKDGKFRATVYMDPDAAATVLDAAKHGAGPALGDGSVLLLQDNPRPPATAEGSQAAKKKKEKLASLTAAALEAEAWCQVEANSVPGSQNVGTLGLRKRGLRDDLASTLAALLLGEPGSGVTPTRREALGHIHSLTLSENEVGPRGAAALVPPCLVAALTLLNLAENRLGDDGAIAVAGALVENGLVELNVAKNGIGAAGTRALGRALGGNFRLLRLNLRGNQAGREGAGALGAGLERGSALEVLNLGQNGLDEASWAALSVGVGRCGSLIDVNPTGNDQVTPIRAISTPIRAILTPIRAFVTPMRAISTPIRAILTPILAISTPILVPFQRQFSCHFNANSCLCNAFGRSVTLFRPCRAILASLSNAF